MAGEAHKVGAIQEQDNQDGLAHLLEHMAFNKVQPSLENLLEIAKVLKVDVRELLRSTEE